MKIETIYGLEWEYKALEEIKDCLIKKWENNPKTFCRLHNFHLKLLDVLVAKNVKAVDVPFEFKDKEHLELFREIRGFIYTDPYLALIFIYCRTTPLDINIRQYLNRHLTSNIVNATWKFYQNLDLLKNSELAKSLFYKGKPVASIPISEFITGKIISYLCSKQNHFYLIDRVKQSGAKESIEELRRNRIYESEEGEIYDYSPYYKQTISKNGMKHIFEVFFQKQYDLLTKETGEVSLSFDEMLCDMTKKPDRRRELSFGDSLKVSDISLIVRFGTNEKEIPLQLLPKYKNLVMNIKDRYTLTDVAADKREKEDETQEAIAGLYNGAITWEKEKGVVPHWLSKNVKWHLGEAFDKVSRVDPETGKRKLAEKIDSAGGRLDEPESVEDNTLKRNNIKCENSDSDIEQVDDKDKLNWLNNLLAKTPKMKAIMEKEYNGESLTDVERKHKERFIKKLKQ